MPSDGQPMLPDGHSEVPVDGAACGCPGTAMHGRRGGNPIWPAGHGEEPVGGIAEGVAPGMAMHGTSGGYPIWPSGQLPAGAGADVPDGTQMKSPEIGSVMGVSPGPHCPLDGVENVMHCPPGIPNRDVPPGQPSSPGRRPRPRIACGRVPLQNVW